MTSLIKVDNIAPSAGGTEFSLTRGVVKMHGRINMSAGTILSSLNVSSITDDTTGTFTFNLTNATTSANNASCSGGAIRQVSWADGGIDCRQTGASAVLLKTIEAGADHDATDASAIGIGDLA